jgi:hypothetical protein
MPCVLGNITQTDLAAIVSKVSKYDAQINKTSKDTGAKATDRSGSLAFSVSPRTMLATVETLTISARYTGPTTTVCPTPSPAMKRPAYTAAKLPPLPI